MSASMQSINTFCSNAHRGQKVCCSRLTETALNTWNWLTWLGMHRKILVTISSFHALYSVWIQLNHSQIREWDQSQIKFVLTKDPNTTECNYLIKRGVSLPPSLTGTNKTTELFSEQCRATGQSTRMCMFQPINWLAIILDNFTMIQFYLVRASCTTDKCSLARNNFNAVTFYAFNKSLRFENFQLLFVDHKF